MDNSNKNDVLELARNDGDRSKVRLILNELFPSENVDVPDPYLGGEKGFEHVFNLLDQACSIIAKKL